ncbi:unnamed protein product [Prorocentrum cordatum]|uniref:Uncharacterized protein n=2 Tax=Prorocentrum cordatum TaxID=2364126 RepID=A0ABN9XX83_9DINO|nr:unnamed protein product [Polarella glacialis]
MVLFEECGTPTPTRQGDGAPVARQCTEERRSLARMTTQEFYEQRAREREELGGGSREGALGSRGCRAGTPERQTSAGSCAPEGDLELVCSRAPVLESDHNAEKLMLAVGEAVGTALKKVGSRLGVARDGSPPLSPSWIGCGWARRDLPARQRMRQVQTSPSLLALASGSEPTPGATAAALRPRAPRWAGGHLSDVPAAALMAEGVSIIWQRSVSDFQDEDGFGDGEDSMTVVTVRSGAAPPLGVGMPLPLNPLLRRSSHALNRIGSATSSWSLEQGSLRLTDPTPPPTRSETRAEAFNPAPSLEHAADSRRSILDYEHLFCQFYVEVAHKRRGPRLAGLLRRMGTSSSSRAVRPSLPDAHAIATAWKAEALECLWENRRHFSRRWPHLSLPSSRAKFEEKLEKLLEDEASFDNELQDHNRVVLTLEPERICHRLLWAVGDAIPPEQILFDIQRGLRRRFPHCDVRCADGMWSPAGIFQILMILFTLLLALGVHSLACAVPVAQQAMAAPNDLKGHKVDLTVLSREERMDQLAARVLLTGSLMQLWLLHAVAAAFPLRSLHSPFRRDLGCLAAYSRTASMLLRYVGPVAALPVPVAMAIRWNRMGRWVGKIAVLLVPTAERQVGWHTLSFCCAASLPALMVAASWSVRSSLYTRHHLSTASAPHPSLFSPT